MSSASMKLGIYFGNDNVLVEERPVPAIGAGEVLVRVAVCGICGSDTMEWYRGPETKRKGGINTGHEIAGEIVEVGAGVVDYRVGDRVIVSHHFPCDQCAHCKEGNETACTKMCEKHIEPGGFAQYVRVLETGVKKGLFRLPAAVSFAQGSLAEPLGCVIRSVRKTMPLAGHSVMVIGSGLVGLLHIKLARLRGASEIIAVDMKQSRLDAALRAGADEGILATSELPTADCIFVCAGSPKAAECALSSLSRGGRLMFFATDGPDHVVSLPLTKFWLSQPMIGFSYGAAPRDMQEAIDLIQSGNIFVDDLITHRFGIDQIADAFDLAANPSDNSLKVIVEPNSDASFNTKSRSMQVPDEAKFSRIHAARILHETRETASKMSKSNGLVSLALVGLLPLSNIIQSIDLLGLVS